MTVELAFAKSRKMLTAPKYARIAQPTQKFARIPDNFFGSADTARELITLREASKARSSTGAKSTLKPSARQFSR